ncbi:hypothetical protein PIB30_015570 [Stylosanthes scabra]|uniref:Uncharacterized protein n=1 Tax=Stylosanthes scabra TaxID=79078 RepID=A0ABU6Q7P7_9FABA|nr:hypothetical protein [Stylosanthes scabra]
MYGQSPTNSFMKLKTPSMGNASKDEFEEYEHIRKPYDEAATTADLQIHKAKAEDLDAVSTENLNQATNSDPKSTIQFQHQQIQANSKFKFQMIDNNSTNQVVELFDLHSEFPNPKAPYLEASNRAIDGSGPTSISNGSVKVVNAALESAEEGVNRPPPKPPNFMDGGKNLRSLSHAIGGTAPSDGDEGLAASSGAVLKGKVDATDLDDDDLGWLELEPVEAADISHDVSPLNDSSAKRPGSNSTEDGAVVRVTGGGILTRRLRRFVLLTPPPLLAAIFPWDHGG